VALSAGAFVLLQRKLPKPDASNVLNNHNDTHTSRRLSNDAEH
jgi:hypothetical protein